MDTYRRCLYCIKVYTKRNKLKSFQNKFRCPFLSDVIKGHFELGVFMSESLVKFPKMTT